MVLGLIVLQNSFEHLYKQVSLHIGLRQCCYNHCDQGPSLSRFSQTGFTTYVIGVGGNLNQLEVEAIASDPDSEHIISVADFSAMDSVIDEIVAATCAKSSECPCHYLWLIYFYALYYYFFLLLIYNMTYMDCIMRLQSFQLCTFNAVHVKLQHFVPQQCSVITSTHCLFLHRLTNVSRYCEFIKWHTDIGPGAHLLRLSLSQQLTCWLEYLYKLLIKIEFEVW